jgi:hypothetical protein
LPFGGHEGMFSRLLQEDENEEGNNENQSQKVYWIDESSSHLLTSF